MIGMIQMPLIHVMAHAVSNGNSVNGGQGNDSFLAKLTALMQGDVALQYDDGEAEVAPELMEDFIAKLIAYMSDEAAEVEGEDMAHMIAALMSITMKSNGEQSQQQNVTRANLQQWLQQAENLLNSARLGQQAEQAMPAQQQQQTSAQQAHAAVPATGDTSAQQQASTAHIHKVVAEFFDLVQQSVNNKAYEQHTRELKSMLRTMLATSGLLSQQHAMEQSLSEAGQRPDQRINIDMLMQLNKRTATFGNAVSMSASGEQTTSSHAQVLEGMKLVNGQLVQPANQPLSVGNQAQALVGQDASAVLLSNESANNSLVLPVSQQIRVQGAEQQPAQSLAALQAQHFADEAGPLVIKHMRFAQLNGISEARIALIPEHLGHINIHIAMKNGQMVAQFIAESAMGKEMIEGQLTQLRTMLQGQGIQVEKLEVLQGEQTNLFQQPREHHDGKQFSESNKNRKPNYEEMNEDFSLDFRDDSMPNHHIYGSSFEAVI